MRPFKVGLGMPDTDWIYDGRTPRWREMVEFAQLGEQAGFDSLWVQDHLLFKFPGLEPEGPWECFSMLAGLAAVTERVELAPLVACTSFRNPALTAKIADTIDEISGGRLILGLGAGWHEPEYQAFGYPFDHRYSRFEEAIKIIHTLLRTGSVDFVGQYYTARECELRPRGPRPNGPPILFGTTGEKMLRLAAAYGDQWNAYFSSTGNLASGVPPLKERIHAACADVGRDPATLELTITVLVDLSNGEAVIPASVGLDSAKPLRGTPEQIAEQLRAYADHGVRHIQIYVFPMTPVGIERLQPVLELLDKS
ncbi:MAG: LLM class F420-dependent oxidoreductase [Chloroflexi bacterium]|nr:MAG: LLM class F420-dependent oxidoreductase [Chloroflexota bacterium]